MVSQVKLSGLYHALLDHREVLGYLVDWHGQQPLGSTDRLPL